MAANFMKILAPLFLVLITALCLTGEAKAQTGAWHIKSACFGCKNKDDRTTVFDMIQNQDKESLGQMLADGDLIFIDKGAVCYPVHDADFFTNWQIRVSGQKGLWWVSVDDLDKPEH